MNPAVTLVACSHGTRSARAGAMVTALVEAVAARLPDTRVIEMFVDVQRPELATALPGVPGEVVVVPLFLSAGFHLHRDIHGAATRHPAAVVAPPLGPDRVLTDVLLHRLRRGGCQSGDAVVLAASASSDRRAVADVKRAAALLSERLNATVTIGVVGGAGVQIADAVAAAKWRADRVAVASYLLMPGYFHSQVEAAGAHVTAEPLLSGPPPAQLVDLAVRRFADAQLRRAA